MGLTKDAVINLRLTGFTKAQAQAKELAAEFRGVDTGVKGIEGAHKKLTKESASGLDKLKKQWRSLAASIQATAVVMGGVAAAGVAFFKLAQRGAALRNVEQSFVRLSGGAEKAAGFLSSLRKATGGAITDQKLMVETNRLLASGLDVTKDQLEAGAKAAVLLGRAMGEDATFSFESLVKGIQRGSPLILDNIGLQLDTSKAFKEAADAAGTTVDALEKKTKAMIILNLVTKQARERSAVLTEDGKLQAEATDLLANRWATLVDGMSRFVDKNPQIVRAIETIALSALAAAQALLPVIAAVTESIEPLIIATGAIAGAKIGFTVGGTTGGVIGGGLGALGGLKIAGSAASAREALEAQLEGGERALVKQFRETMGGRDTELLKAAAKSGSANKVRLHGAG